VAWWLSSKGHPASRSLQSVESLLNGPLPRFAISTIRHRHTAGCVCLYACGKQGELPKELDPGRQYKLMDVHVNLVRKEQDYRPPTPPKYIAFSGGGRTLGSASAASAAAAPPAPAPPANPTSSNELVIDDTQPVRALPRRFPSTGLRPAQVE
jgi:hypothetical protein